MGSIKLALLNTIKNFKNEKELKSSFIITIIGMTINDIAFLTLWYYFGKTVGELNGWKPIDVFGLYGFSSTCFGIVVSIFSGIFEIPNYISTGNLDKFLLTPKNILIKISTSKISTSALGDLLFGVTCFVIYTLYNKLTVSQLLLIIFLLIISAIVFFSFSLTCMSISFYLMDGYNVSHGLWDMFLSNSLYYGGAYTGLLRLFFILVMPSLLIGTIPVEIFKNISIIKILLLIVFAIFWLFFSIKFFYKSLRKYESNNLFGFGN